MEEIASTAKLVDTIAPEAGRPLTATVPRSQVEAALAEDGSADLILDVARIHEGERENRTATISWERPDLEELLHRASGDQIVLTFDQAELERMLDASDVEAHGFREKALVLTVAAATAAGMAGTASAHVLDPGSQITPAAATQAPISGLATDTSVGGQRDPDALSKDPLSNVIPAEPSVASNVITDRGSDPTRIPAEPSVASNVITDRGSDPTRIPAEPSGGGGGFSVPDSAVEAALAGGLALLITGAAFVTRTQRRQERPA